MTGNCNNKLNDGCVDACNFCPDLKRRKELEKEVKKMKDTIEKLCDFNYSYDDLCKLRDDNCLVGHVESLRKTARSAYQDLKWTLN